jgi:hypothetical protein
MDTKCDNILSNTDSSTIIFWQCIDLLQSSGVLKFEKQTNSNKVSMQEIIKLLIRRLSQSEYLAVFKMCTEPIRIEQQPTPRSKWGRPRPFALAHGLFTLLATLHELKIIPFGPVFVSPGQKFRIEGLCEGKIDGKTDNKTQKTATATATAKTKTKRISVKQQYKSNKETSVNMVLHFLDRIGGRAEVISERAELARKLRKLQKRDDLCDALLLAKVDTLSKQQKKKRIQKLQAGRVVVGMDVGVRSLSICAIKN